MEGITTWDHHSWLIDDQNRYSKIRVYVAPEGIVYYKRVPSSRLDFQPQRDLPELGNPVAYLLDLGVFNESGLKNLRSRLGPNETISTSYNVEELFRERLAEIEINNYLVIATHSSNPNISIINFLGKIKQHLDFSEITWFRRGAEARARNRRKAQRVHFNPEDGPIVA